MTSALVVRDGNGHPEVLITEESPMDEERRRNLAQQIGRIKDFDQLFVISHDDAFEGFTDRVVSVRGHAEGA